MPAESSARETADGIIVAVDLQDAASRTRICRLIANVPGLVLAARSDEADVVVTDMLPAHDEAAVVIGDAALIAAAAQRGFAGLLSHQISSRRFRIAVEAAREGLVCIPRVAASPPANGDVGAFDDASEEVSGGQSLSARERQALVLMADGHSNKEIARRLGISVRTAKFHVASVIAKLGATTRTEAVALAFRHGLLHL